MTLPMTLWLCAALAAPGGGLAFLAGTEQPDLRVCVLGLDSGAVTPVGPGACDGAPQWSPDGRRLAFETAAGGGLGIYLVNADGSGGRCVSASFAWNHAPRWASDAQRLVYASSAAMGLECAAVVCDLDTGAEIVWGGEEVPPLLRPVWLPSTLLMKALDPGEKLDEAGENLVALANEAETSGALLAIALVKRKGHAGITTEPVLVTRTRWAPLLPLLVSDSLRFAEYAIEPNRKGDSIAYESNDGGDREIYAIGKRGIANLSNHRAADWNPVWDRSGKWIAFESFRGGRRGIYTVFRDTANVHAVDASPAYDAWAPAFSPDGKWLAYVAMRSGAPKIYISRTDGTDCRPALEQPGVQYAPAWRPEVKD